MQPIVKYSNKDELKDLSDENKLKACDNMIAQLSCQVMYYSQQLLVMNDGITTKRGRMSAATTGDNSALKKQVRATMQSKVFGKCKFIGKHDLHNVYGALATTIMKDLNIGMREVLNGDRESYNVEETNYRDRCRWWVANSELVGQLFVEHRTKKTQELKIRYMTGKC